MGCNLQPLLRELREEHSNRSARMVADNSVLWQ